MLVRVGQVVESWRPQRSSRVLVACPCGPKVRVPNPGWALAPWLFYLQIWGWGEESNSRWARGACGLHTQTCPFPPPRLWTKQHGGPGVQALAPATVPSPLWVSACLARSRLLPGRALTWAVCGWEPRLAHWPTCQLPSALGQASGPGVAPRHMGRQGVDKPAACSARAARSPSDPSGRSRPRPGRDHQGVGCG